MRYIKRFAELGMKDLPLVGGKNSSLGEMFSTLSEQGVAVPNGFATTTEAYRHYLEHNKLFDRIAGVLDALEVEDVKALATAGKQIRRWFNDGEMPPHLAAEIVAAYGDLAAEYGPDPDVAVRSSATAEDLPNASFAGQQDTYLNIRGAAQLVASCKKVYASLFTDRAISYRAHQGFGHMDVALSIGVQKMVRSDLAASGVMFTLDTETGFRNAVFITSAYGLGENVVQGQVNPDEFYVFKPTLDLGKRPIIRRHLGEKSLRMVYNADPEAASEVSNTEVPAAERAVFSISDDEVLQLARYAVIIEKHYSDRAGHPMPMDIEWAKDGQTGKLFIVQARPETVQSTDDGTYQEIYKLETRGEVLCQGKSVGQKIAAGTARVILDAEHMTELQPGEILITDITDPDWEPVMKIAGAIVTNRGGRTCHAAIIARELGIPAIVGCGNATEVLKSGTDVTISCAEGNNGFIYSGLQKYSVERIDLSHRERPKTKIYVNVGNPEVAFEVSKLPADGVGLARLEFIINNTIKVHPRALLEYDKVSPDVQRQIDTIVAGYGDHRTYYVRKLAEGVSNIAAAFYPRPVIVRMSDFKSNEYAAMIGGTAFEPDEENPMIGYRGASRYHSADFAECFAMECEAMKIVRDDMGLTNVRLMLPFVRTVDEGCKVLEIMAANGLERGNNGLEVYIMCEIPSNALLADQFLEHFDGMSIGSNDLTQLTLGVDRDSGILTGFDERDEAVRRLMGLAIAACNRSGRYVGICGQAPSDFPEITRWLVEQGIQSLSLNPDSVLDMTGVVLEEEKRRDKKAG